MLSQMIVMSIVLEVARRMGFSIIAQYTFERYSMRTNANNKSSLKPVFFIFTLLVIIVISSYSCPQSKLFECVCFLVLVTVL